MKKSTTQKKGSEKKVKEQTSSGRKVTKKKKDGAFKDPTTVLKPSAQVGSSNTKRMLVYQIERSLAKTDTSRPQLAVLMKTSRAAVNRLLDPNNKSINLQTLERASQALGKKLHIFLYDKESRRVW
jgi:DNA-binding Xre family transcriptional regulator